MEKNHSNGQMTNDIKPDLTFDRETMIKDLAQSGSMGF